MEDGKANLLQAEYATLREEILQNKKYVFERPLLIITAAGVASIKLSGEAPLAFLPLLLVIVLLTNLWFTVNRLHSNARIVAYLSVALEPSAVIEWIGWENALRKYRSWSKRGTSEERSRAVAEHIDLAAIPDAMMFYPALWILHLATVIITAASSGASLINSMTPVSITAFALTMLTSAIFLYYCLGPDRPGKLRSVIETQRATWIAVFEDRSEGDVNRDSKGPDANRWSATT